MSFGPLCAGKWFFLLFLLMGFECKLCMYSGVMCRGMGGHGEFVDEYVEVVDVVVCWWE